MRKPRTTVRFWVMLDGGNVVRIKLRAGQEVCHSHGGLTDEGFSYTGRTWRFEDGEVVECWVTNARDCDGPITRSGTMFCPVDDLKAGYIDEEFDGDGRFAPIRYPKWRERSYTQRDAYAEAAGY